MLTTHKILGTVAYMGGIMSLPEPFAWSWGNMAAFTPNALCGDGEYIHYDRAKLSLHDYARNEMLSRMRGDWILMLDTDISFEPDLAARMVRTMYKYDLDVLTGIYSYKHEPHFPVLYMHNPENDRHEIIADWDRSKEIFEIGSAGAGVLLIRRHVCERITAELSENPFDRYPRKGEDHSFFTRLRKLGIKAFCAPHIEVSHLEYLGVRPSTDYLPPAKFAHTYETIAF
jgi:GT2 family glycosyltransferase